MPLYKDEDILGNLFCKSKNCKQCFGTDYNGEPNGCGCEGRDDFIEANIESLIENSQDDIFYTQTELNKAVQDEREACALIIEKYANEYLNHAGNNILQYDIGKRIIEGAEAIRARNK